MPPVADSLRVPMIATSHKPEFWLMEIWDMTLCCCAGDEDFRFRSSNWRAGVKIPVPQARRIFEIGPPGRRTGTNGKSSRA